MTVSVFSFASEFMFLKADCLQAMEHDRMYIWTAMPHQYDTGLIVNDMNKQTLLKNLMKKALEKEEALWQDLLSIM